jgi:tetratricopeptide (TPR) repeat protein
MNEMRGSKQRFVTAGMLVVLTALLVNLGGRPASGQPKPAPPDKKDKDKTKKVAGLDGQPFEFPEDRDARNQLDQAPEYLKARDVQWRTLCKLLQDNLNAKNDSFYKFEEKDGDRVEVRRVSVKTIANRIIGNFPKDGLIFYQQFYGQEADKELQKAVAGGYDPAALADLSQRYFHTRAGGQATVLLAAYYLDRGSYAEAAHTYERLLERPNSDDLLSPRMLYRAALAFTRSGDPRHTDLAQKAWGKLLPQITPGGLTLGRKTYTPAELRAELGRPLDVSRAGGHPDWAMRAGNAARNGIADGGPPYLDPIFPPAPMITLPDPADKKLYDEAETGNAWVKGQLERLYPRDSTPRGVQLPASFPITAGDLVVYRTYDGVHAVAVRDHIAHGIHYRAGQHVWAYNVDMGVRQLIVPPINQDVLARGYVERWWSQYQSEAASNKDATQSVLYENPLLGALTHDDRYAYLIDDLGIPPPPPTQTPDYSPNPTRNHPTSGELARAIKSSRLVAIGLETGMYKWYLGRPMPDDRWNPPADHDMGAVRDPLPPARRLSDEEVETTDNAFMLCSDDTIFLGPPLPLNGRLYVLIEREGTTRLLCLDPTRLVHCGTPGRPEMAPALVWAQKLGGAIHSLPGDAARRFQGCFLAASDGIMVCPTNSGAVVGVHILSRSLLWGHTYRRHEPPPAPSPGSPRFDGSPVVRKTPLKESRWRATAPIIANGRVLLAGYDSDKLECLDLRTGAKLWEVPREETDLYLGGVVNGKVIVVGKSRVRAYHLTKLDPNAAAGAPPAPQLAWESAEAIPVPTGHGALTHSTYFVPVRRENAGRRDSAGKETAPAAEIWAINVETGAVTSKTASRKKDDAGDLVRYGLGNLVYHNGLVFAQSPWELAVYPQLDQKRAEMDRRLKANPNDPVGLLDRGELQLDDGKLKEAVADFKRAKENDPPEAIRWRLREKLYTAYTELLRADFAAVEPHLDEYKVLCELPLDTDDLAEKTRRQAESVHRQRLFLCLLGKGRETQGRFGEAFDHYLALARLSGDKLDEDPEDPTVKLPPDVLARGRIERMLRRAKDPAARKALDERVNKEWDAVKGANDLPRLREFVSVFGPFFPAGAEAQFKLAERLLTTGAEADAREAQSLLSQLRSTADSVVVRAKATEALARVMFDAGLLEDAVGLYLQLGQDYPQVEIRDGKTGSDFLTDLLTDKRLLPYLEPSRYPLPPRVKAEQQPPGKFDAGPVAYEVEPAGDLFPAFRRLRFVFEVPNPVAPNWTLRAYDRATGNERCRFSDLTMPVNVGVRGPDGRPVWDPGSLDLSRFVQAHGQLLLVQLGSNVYCLDLAEKKERWRRNLLGEGVTGGTPTPDITSDGGVILPFDHLRLMVGRSAVLQPGYVSVLTRTDAGRALELFEPLTGRPLWTRHNVSDRAMVFGDPHHVLLVETDAKMVPLSTRLLRASDGMKADGTANAASLMASARMYRAFGRTVLLSEATDKAKVLRLHDLAAGKDVWRKEYHPNAKPIRSLDPAWAGFIDQDGPAEVVDVRTGATVAKLTPDAEEAADFGDAFEACHEAILLADAGRYYLVLDRDRGTTPAARRATSGGQIRYRTLPVNGPVYAFDRATGKLAWAQGERPFEHQALILDHFAELPVLVAAVQGADRSGTTAYRVAVVEKDRGLLLFEKSLPPSQPFQAVKIDARNGTVDLCRSDLQVRIMPDR